MTSAVPTSASIVTRITMPARFRWWAVLGGVARLAHRLSRLNLAIFERMARQGGSAGAYLSAPAAVTASRKAMRSVPAYRALVERSGRPRPARTPQAWLAQLPVTTKRSYIDQWSLAHRCVGGAIPASGCDLDESAGSTGSPYTWIRSQAELSDVHRSLALLARHLLPANDRPLIVLNAFSMGAWATGTNVAVALRSVGTVKSCGPDVDKVLGAIQLLGPEPTYVVCGYPPFLRQLLDAAAQRGLDLSAMSLYGFVGGEGMTEAQRRRLERIFSQVWSAYGASDLDIGVAAETPISIWLRQQAAARPELAQALFGRTDRLPMVFQYDPCDYFVETILSPSGASELVVTVARPMLSPRIRYNVGDEGGTVDFATATAICLAAGLDPEDAESQPFRLPFLFVHGRSDQTVSFMGANLYPEDVSAGIGTHGDSDALGAFCMELAEVGDDEVRPLVHIEVRPAAQHEGLEGELVEAIRRHLAVASADYRAALEETDKAADLRVRLWEPGTGPFASNAGRIKHRQVLAPPASLGDNTDLVDRFVPEVAAILTESVRAPSAHNAQPWRLVPTGSHSLELHYDHLDYLPFDPDDRDAYLALGAFFETLSLAAHRHGHRADICTRFERAGTDLWVGDIVVRPARPDEETDPLAAAAAARHTNRLPYDKTPVPPVLRAELSELGNTMVPPRATARLVARASIMSWRDRRFVTDLRRWTRADTAAPDGMTPAGLSLSRVDWAALRVAFRLGRVPAPLALVYSSRDLRLLSGSVAVCVLGSPSLEPADLFDAGRRLLRSWVTVSAAGWACHPISIAVDRPETAPAVAALAGTAVPVAVYRVGHPTSEAPRSNRRPLADVLRAG